MVEITVLGIFKDIITIIIYLFFRVYGDATPQIRSLTLKQHGEYIYFLFIIIIIIITCICSTLTLAQPQLSVVWLDELVSWLADFLHKNLIRQNYTLFNKIAQVSLNLLLWSNNYGSEFKFELRCHDNVSKFKFVAKNFLLRYCV